MTGPTKTWRKWLRDYIEVWIAVGGVTGITFGGIYFSIVVWHFPLWALILTMIVILHLAIGWLWLIRKVFE